MRIFKSLLVLVLIVSCRNDKKNNIKTDSEMKSSLELDQTNVVLDSDTLYVENYINGNSKIIAEKSNGILHGMYLSYNANNTKKEVGAYKQGKKHGLWKLHSPKGELDEVFKYKADSLEYDYDINDFKLEEVFIKSLETNIDIPKAWSSSQDKEGVDLIVIKECSNTSKYCPRIVVTSEVLPDGKTFEDYIDYTNQALEKLASNFQKVNTRFFKVGKLDAYRIQYKSTLNEINLGSAVSLIKKDDTIIVINISAENTKEYLDYYKYRLLFVEIVNSIN